MATLEEFGVLFQMTAQTFRLVRNMRNNANGYQTRAAGGMDPVKLGLEMKADATAFKVRLQQLTDIAARNQGLIVNALAFLSAVGSIVTLANANTLKNNLVAVCDHVLAAILTTAQQCTDEAALILANTPNYDGLWIE